MLLRGADVLEEHADELALIESRENGKPVQDARQNDISFLIAIFRFFGSLIDKLPTEFYDKGAIYTSTYLEPVGVVGEIIPFNWPPIHTGGKLAACRWQHRRDKAQRAGPAHGHPDRGAAEHSAPRRRPPPPSWNRSAGRPAAGRPPQGPAGVIHRIQRRRRCRRRQAAKNIMPAVIELRGKIALAVFDDADLDQAVRNALEGGFYNKGEACTATSRVLVQDGLYDAFVSRLTEAVGKLKVGRGYLSVHVGPVVTRTQQQRVLNYIQIGNDEAGRPPSTRGSRHPELIDAFWARRPCSPTSPRTRALSARRSSAR